MNDTHDQIMQTVLRYLKASETFERRPSESTKRTARRELRNLMSLAKQRQDEIISKYETHMIEFRKDKKNNQ
jgi:site-specific recombinase XerC